jgi:plastocyanin
MMRRFGIALTLALAPLGLAACGGNDDDGAGTGASPATAGNEEQATIGASDFRFTDATVRPGVTVKLMNADAAPHSVFSKDDAWEWDDATQSFTAPREPDTYEFICGVHGDSMTGTLTVRA